MKKKRDWLDEFIEEEGLENIMNTPDTYMWDPKDDSLYRLSVEHGPQEYSVADHAWVWSEWAAGILIGETWGKYIEAAEAQQYIDFLEEQYGAKS